MSKHHTISSFDMPKEKCHTCMLNKITRIPFRSVEINTKLLKLIHSDLYDFHSIRPLGNKKHMITFMDD